MDEKYEGGHIKTDDSDITCNGGNLLKDRELCRGLEIDTIKPYSVDQPRKLVVQIDRWKVSSIDYLDCDNEPMNLTLNNRNWHLSIYRHGVVLHTVDKGASVEITSPDSFIIGAEQKRRHPNRSEIESMTLVVGSQRYCLGGCRFTIRYGP